MNWTVHDYCELNSEVFNKCRKAVVSRSAGNRCEEGNKKIAVLQSAFSGNDEI